MFAISRIGAHLGNQQAGLGLVARSEDAIGHPNALFAKALGSYVSGLSSSSIPLWVQIAKDNIRQFSLFDDLGTIAKA